MGKASEFFSKLKSVRHIELMAIGLVVVLALTVYFSCASCADEQTTNAVPANADYCTAMQIRLENVVSQIDGVGNASIVINWDKSVPSSAFASSQSENPKATGAVIVCDGGNSTKVKLDVTYAVSTLLGLSIENIIVYKKSN